MVDIAIITAPRKLPTLNISIQSLREAGVTQHIWIFSEPGDIDLRDVNNCTLIVNETRLGAFRNYDQALAWLMSCDGACKAVLQDDYIYSKDLSVHLAGIEKEKDFGYFNLFTNSNHPTVHDWAVNDGWNRTYLGSNQVWGAAFVMQADKVDVLRKHEYYLTTMMERNEMIDGAVSEVFKRLELPMYHHRPSLIHSIGFMSTLNHKCKTDGYKFND